MAMSGWEPSAADLLDLLARSARGPRRGGLYALWLTLRVSQDFLLDPPLNERAMRRRLTALESRLSSLTIPPPLRRALGAALGQLHEATRESVPGILNTLIAPAKEGAGPEAADAIRRAERSARQALASHRPLADPL
jgi:hypothetical protein